MLVLVEFGLQDVRRDFLGYGIRGTGARAGSGNGSRQLSDSVSNYLVALELLKKMNDVSELIYQMDMSDTVKASKGNADIAQIMGESLDAAISSGRVSAETAGMAKSWRRIDENFLSDVVRRTVAEPVGSVK